MSLKKGTKDVSLLTKIPPNVEPKTITTNGTYVASDEGLDGYSQVEVNIGKYAPRIIKFSGYGGTELDYEIENLDMSRITNCDSMFGNCANLKQIKSFDTSNVTSMRNFVQYCHALSEFPLIDMGKVKDFTQGMYSSRIKKMPKLNFQSITLLFQTFYSCNDLTDLGGFENLGQAYLTTANANNENYTLKLSYSTKLTHDSLMNVINNLYDIKTKGVKPQQLVLGSDNLAKLSEEERNIAVSKGWTLS